MEGMKRLRIGINKDDKVLFIDICFYEGGNYDFNYVS